METYSTDKLLQAWAAAAGIEITSPGIAHLVRNTSVRAFDAGFYLIEQGDLSDSVFLVLNGSLKVTWFTRNGHEIWLADLQAGELVGETAALCSAPRTSSVVTRTVTTLAEVSCNDFQTALSLSSDLTMHIALILAKRVQATSQQLINLVGLPLASRLHAELQRRGSPDENDKETLVLNSPPSVSLLAEQMHASREATSRAMSILLKRGLLKRSKGTMQIIVPQD